MTIWVDAQISPKMAEWIKKEFNIESIAVKDIGLIRAKDKEIFNLQQQFGPPPQIIFLTCGNTSNKKLIEIFNETLYKAFDLIKSGEALVEISD